jgi:glycosyltransferase 2 family protein
MDRSSIRRFSPLISIALILCVAIGLVFLIPKMPLDVLGEVRISEISGFAVLMVLAMQIVFHGMATELWRRVVVLLTGRNVGFISSYVQLAAVAVGKYVPGKVWGFLARAGEMHRQKIPVRDAVIGSILEQMLLLGSAVLVAAFAAALALPQYRPYFVFAIVISLASVIVLAFKGQKIALWITSKRQGVTLPAPTTKVHPVRLMELVLGYTALWLVSGAIFSTIFFALFDAQVSIERVAILVLGNTLGVLIGFFAFFVPGGIGVREAVATIVAGSLLPVGELLIAAVVYRAWMVAIDGLNAIFVLAREVKQATTGAPIGDESKARR